MLRCWFILVSFLSQVAVAQAADRAPRFFVSIDNSLRFFADTKSQRTHLRDYCLYMRCAGPSDGRTGLEPEGLCSRVIESEKARNGGSPCAAVRFKNADGVSYWEPTRRDLAPYRTVWHSSTYAHQLPPETHAGAVRTVEFEVPDAKPGDRCTLELRHGQQTVWTETVNTCAAGIKKLLDVSPEPYLVSGNVIRGDQIVPIPAHTFTVRHMIVMAMGDSIAAGEGLPHHFYQDNRTLWLFGTRSPGTWLERRCHRSFFNYSLMAMAIAAEAERTLSIDYFNYACSGARLLTPVDQRVHRADTAKADPCKHGDGGVLDPYRGFLCAGGMKRQAARFAPNAMDGNQELPWLPPQIDDAKATLAQLQALNPGTVVRPDYLVISIGGNDVLFGDLIIEGLLKNGCNPTWTSRLADFFGYGSGVPCVLEAARKRMTELPGELERLEKAVAALKPRTVLLVGYLDPTHDAKGETCGKNPDKLKERLLGPGYLNRLGANILPSEAEKAYQSVLVPLNGVLRDFARSRSRDETTWVYVDPNSTSNAAKRGWCAPRSWFTTYADSEARQGDPGGTAHPNLYGQNSLSYTIRCHMAQLGALSPQNVCKGLTCNCAVAAPAGEVKRD
jgi:hypothetical protein